MSDRDQALNTEKKTLKEELKLPASSSEIRAQVKTGELNVFEIEKVLVHVDTTEETRRALTAKDSVALPLAKGVLPKVDRHREKLKLEKLKLTRAAQKKALATKRSAEQVRKYQPLQLPKPRTKTAAEKRDAKSLEKLTKKYRRKITTGRPKRYR